MRERQLRGAVHPILKLKAAGPQFVLVRRKTRAQMVIDKAATWDVRRVSARSGVRRGELRSLLAKVKLGMVILHRNFGAVQYIGCKC